VMTNVHCPNCDAHVPYVAELAGREIFCLGCGCHFVIPNLGPEPSRPDETMTVKPVLVNIRSPIEPAEDPGGLPPSQQN